MNTHAESLMSLMIQATLQQARYQPEALLTRLSQHKCSAILQDELLSSEQYQPSTGTEDEYRAPDQNASRRQGDFQSIIVTETEDEHRGDHQSQSHYALAYSNAQSVIVK